MAVEGVPDRPAASTRHPARRSPDDGLDEGDVVRVTASHAVF